MIYKHEPECQLLTWGVPVPTCTCAAIHSAYQRGREDAAQAVIYEGHHRKLPVYVAAARGDGEQI